MTIQEYTERTGDALRQNHPRNYPPEEQSTQSRDCNKASGWALGKTEQECMSEAARRLREGE